MIPVPKPLLWDYAEAPQDVIWRLQRIADYFPHYGTDRTTVRQLHEHRDELKLDVATRALIDEYYRVWQAR
jgi:hypothetical protein